MGIFVNAVIYYVIYVGVEFIHIYIYIVGFGCFFLSVSCSSAFHEPLQN